MVATECDVLQREKVIGHGICLLKHIKHKIITAPAVPKHLPKWEKVRSIEMLAYHLNMSSLFDAVIGK